MQWIALALALSGPPPPAGAHTISGIVRHRDTDEPIPNALVVLQCTCLEGTREQFTNDGGAYRFAGLPDGTYTIQVLVGHADVAKIVTLGPASQPRARAR